jgi:hypothetical protein
VKARALLRHPAAHGMCGTGATPSVWRGFGRPLGLIAEMVGI